MKMKLLFVSILTGLGLLCSLHAQRAEISPDQYRILSVNSQTASDSAGNAFDGNLATWWSVNTNQAEPLPAVLTIDLGRSYPVCGFSYQCNILNSEDKLLRYAVYVSNDTNRWGKVQAQSDIFWPTPGDTAVKELFFGAVPGRYVKIVYLDNTNTWNQAIQTAELRIWSDDTVTRFKTNQYIETDSLPELVSSHDTTALKAFASSGLPVSFRIVSGDASILEEEGLFSIICGGREGRVVIEAFQPGNDTCYPVSRTFSVQVQNPDLYGIILTTPLVESEPIVMPSDTLHYVLRARAEIGSAFNRITDISVSVDGNPLTAHWNARTGALEADFYPGKYGKFEVSFRATASNGRDTTVRRQIRVDSAVESRTVRTFEHMLINFPEPGRTNGGVYRFPQHTGTYRQIIAKLDVQCPEIEGGCDDWDRVAWIEILAPDGQWREIIRYTTAYGVPCKHELDVSDFASWLQGEVPMRMFIDTWGTGGYDINLDFEFVKGTPQYLYTGITPLWNGNFPFGDMRNLQPLDTLSVEKPQAAAALRLKVVTTGHGWGNNNTANAAEFYKAKHTLYVNTETFDHEPWMKCNPNPDNCTGQRGTWTYNRAGWCPGAIAPGYNYDVSKQSEASVLDLKFILQESYIDYCHPSNPDCVSGVTCADCNDTYNPQYYIASYLISYYDKMYDSLPDVANRQTAGREELHFSTYPNPASDRFFVQTFGEIGSGNLQLFDMDGNVVRYAVFKDGAALNGMEFRVEDLPSGFYIVRIQTLHGNGISKIIIK